MNRLNIALAVVLVVVGGWLLVLGTANAGPRLEAHCGEFAIAGAIVLVGAAIAAGRASK